MKILPKKNSFIFFFLTLTIFSCLLIQCSKTPQEEKTADNNQNKKYAESSRKQGIWFPSPTANTVSATNNSSTHKDLNQLKTLGYLSGYNPAPARTGITKYNQQSTFNGLNLLVSGHKPYAALMDMAGNILHEWTFAYENLGISSEELIVNPLVDENFKNYWRRVYLYENGDILAIFDYQGMIKIDNHSKLLWAYPGRPHHDVFVADNGDIWTLSAEKKNLQSINPTVPVLEEFICRLNSEGKEIEKISLIKCFENSPYISYLKINNANDKEAAALDIFHSNSLQQLDGAFEKQNPAFKKGNFLVSIRQLNLLVIVDTTQKSIVWVKEGPWKAQHEAQLLANGNILLFDNKGGVNFSRILEVDAFSDAIVWSYQATQPTLFFSPIVGAQQRLPNGNTLITDTVGGKAFEVTPLGEITWEFVNFYRSGKNNELIAALFEVKRYSKDYPVSWIDKSNQQ